jgi:hypothetical protein
VADDPRNAMISLTSLLMCEGGLTVQLVCWAVWCVLIYYVMMGWFVKYVTTPLLSSMGDKPKAQFGKLMRKLCNEAYGMGFTDDSQGFIFGCTMFAVLAQHLISAVLCSFSTFGPAGYALIPALPGGQAVAAALARHGALCEAGWEMQDVVTNILPRIISTGAVNGTDRIMLIHHTLGLTMALPMNLFYGDNVTYHSLVFAIQFAACFGLAPQFYGFTCDQATYVGMLQCKVCGILQWTSMVYGRLFVFVTNSYALLRTCYADGRMPLFGLACFGLTMMALMNLLMLTDASIKLVKLLPKDYKQKADCEKAVTESLSSHGLVSGQALSAGEKGWAKLRGTFKAAYLMKKASGSDEHVKDS